MERHIKSWDIIKNWIQSMENVLLQNIKSNICLMCHCGKTFTARYNNVLYWSTTSCWCMKWKKDFSDRKYEEEYRYYVSSCLEIWKKPKDYREFYWSFNSKKIYLQKKNKNIEIKERAELKRLKEKYWE